MSVRDDGLDGAVYTPDAQSEWRQVVHLTVNGEPHEVEVGTDKLVVDLLRDDLGLTGTKNGCGIGVCGVCTILLNDLMVSSCLLLAVQVDGFSVKTIEGIGEEGALDPVQQAFMEHGGFQCGICTPGQIVAARALLDETPSPSEVQVREWMTGNLCRCTGYYKIIKSVLAASTLQQPGSSTG